MVVRVVTRFKVRLIKIFESGFIEFTFLHGIISVGSVVGRRWIRFFGCNFRCHRLRCCVVGDYGRRVLWLRWNGGASMISAAGYVFRIGGSVTGLPLPGIGI